MTKTTESLDCYSVSGDDSHFANTVEHSDARAKQRSVLSGINVVWDLNGSLSTESTVFAIYTTWSVNISRGSEKSGTHIHRYE